MQPITRLTTALVLSGISASIAYSQTTITPEVLVYDGFESNSFGNFPFTATATSSNGTGSIAPVIISPSATERVYKGNFAMKNIARDSTLPVTDPSRLSRISYAAQFPREQTLSETILLTYYYYDVYGEAGVPTTGLDSILGQRFWMALRDSDGVTPFTGVNQIAALGTWNSANTTFGQGFSGNNWFGAAPALQNLGNHYAGRLISVISPNGLTTGATTPTAGPSAPQWFFFGVGPDYRRTSGWKKMTMAYNVRRSEFFVDSRLHGAWDINPSALPAQRKVDCVVINPTENQAQNVWVDEVSVRAYPVGSLQILPKLGDIVNPAAIATVPFSVSLVPTGGNTNSAVSAFTVSASAAGEINVQMATDVRGSYDLIIDGGSWLKKRVAVNITDHGTFEVAANMQNGDVDGSGEVDAADIDLVISNFGQTGVGPTSGDVDLSDEVDAADIDIVIANFGGVDN